MEKNKFGVKHDDGHYSKMTGNDKNVSYSIYDKNPSLPGHKGTHINYNTETGKGSIVEHDENGNTTRTDTSCYLTTACMKHYLSNFDDNCYELSVLRWFRDNFVSEEDIKHYYSTAPYIVEGIENDCNKDIVYDYIYDNVVDYCVTAIENGNYIEAYKRYKDSIINLEQVYARKELVKRLVKTLS